MSEIILRFYFVVFCSVVFLVCRLLELYLTCFESGSKLIRLGLRLYDSYYPPVVVCFVSNHNSWTLFRPSASLDRFKYYNVHITTSFSICMPSYKNMALNNFYIKSISKLMDENTGSKSAMSRNTIRFQSYHTPIKVKESKSRYST